MPQDIGIYELNQVDLMRDVFVWAYERSAAQYSAIRQSIGEPDPIKLRYRSQLHELIAGVIVQCLGSREARGLCPGKWCTSQ